MSRKKALSRELGESFVTALAATEPAKVRDVVQEWGENHRDELHALVVDGLGYQADLWEQRIADKGQEVADRMFENMRSKFDNTLYDMVLEITATYARDENGSSIRRHPVATSVSRSSSNDEDWDYGDGDGRSSNDDRSDSMNPNNDAYQDSMDNRSDQMNPNNDAYHSSRR